MPDGITNAFPHFSHKSTVDHFGCFSLQKQLQGSEWTGSGIKPWPQELSSTSQYHLFFLSFHLLFFAVHTPSSLISSCICWNKDMLRILTIGLTFKLLIDPNVGSSTYAGIIAWQFVRPFYKLDIFNLSLSADIFIKPVNKKTNTWMHVVWSYSRWNR